MWCAWPSAEAETKRFSHAGQGTMGHVVHEPWPLIASKHALRIILADSRQTECQDQTTKPAHETGQTNKPRGGERRGSNVDACRLRISSSELFRDHPPSPPSLSTRVGECQLPLRISSPPRRERRHHSLRHWSPSGISVLATRMITRCRQLFSSSRVSIISSGDIIVKYSPLINSLIWNLQVISRTVVEVFRRGNFDEF